ncbi:uncharacterized protein LOC6551821 [Drosophila erecta]|uniref:GG16381 n=1 Tax=Drosophila erecta TaxID=7220 RepID=B3NZ43_DROER|nr:uncharacterized protein LOC6551821 [Drosophila erecta]EDV48585.1 uncharacterized protein Dere_GG16381 [Drosophila erecta]
MHGSSQLPLTLALAFALLCVGCTQVHAQDGLFRCSVQYRCSDEKELAWAMADERCYVFHNNCLLKVEQCARKSSGRSELVETSREICKPSCTKDCPVIYEPVCAQIFQEEYLTFSNECEMRNYICTNERPYSFLAVGECVEDPVG